jgi:hypothetical protein
MQGKTDFVSYKAAVADMAYHRQHMCSLLSGAQGVCENTSTCSKPECLDNVTNRSFMQEANLVDAALARRSITW